MALNFFEVGIVALCLMAGCSGELAPPVFARVAIAKPTWLNVAASCVPLAHATNRGAVAGSWVVDMRVAFACSCC